jgi:hypothetical protein
LAEEVSFAEDDATDPAPFTLTMTCPAAGQDGEEARRFAPQSSSSATAAGTPCRSRRCRARR